MNIPTEVDWNGYETDFDAVSAYTVFFGKSLESIQDDFRRDVLSRVSDLRFMPDRPFQYYIIAFKKFVLERKFRQFTSADAANSFLELIEYTLRNKPFKILPVINQLQDAIDFVGGNQELYDAPESIYGSFLDKTKEIKSLIGLTTNGPDSINR